MKHEVDLSRRKFLKRSGLLGLTLGVLSLPPFGWGKAFDVPADMAEEDNRLAKRHSKQASKKSNTIREAQQQLKAAGFDPGPADGRLGPNTRTALRDYQAAHKLPQTGKLDRATQKSLTAGG